VATGNKTTPTTKEPQQQNNGKKSIHCLILATPNGLERMLSIDPSHLPFSMLVETRDLAFVV
jgi:hypothetical protein